MNEQIEVLIDKYQDALDSLDPEDEDYWPEFNIWTEVLDDLRTLHQPGQ